MTDEVRKRKRGPEESEGDLNTFEWNITNFLQALDNKKVNEKMTSPVFVGKSTGLPNSFWRIEVYPKGEEDSEKDNLVIYLALSKELNTHNPFVKAKSAFYLLNGNLEEVCSREEDSVDEYGPEEPRLGYRGMATHSKLLDHTTGFMDDDILRIKIKVWIQNEEINASASKKPYGQLYKNFSQLLASSKYSDVDIVVDDCLLKVHKNILASLSPVFDAMFQNEMSESLTNTVKIEDFSSKTVKGMLQFIYSGNVDCVEEDFMELLKIAEKYELEELKMICTKAAILKLSVENVIELLILGDLYNAPELKYRAMVFINSNKANPMFSMENENAAFEQFVKEHPKLVFEMYKTLRNSDVDVHYSGDSDETLEEVTRFTTNAND